jgi:hypothetical protein
LGHHPLDFGQLLDYPKSAWVVDSIYQFSPHQGLHEHALVGFTQQPASEFVARRILHTSFETKKPAAQSLITACLE